MDLKDIYTEEELRELGLDPKLPNVPPSIVPGTLQPLKSFALRLVVIFFALGCLLLVLLFFVEWSGEIVVRESRVRICEKTPWADSCRYPEGVPPGEEYIPLREWLDQNGGYNTVQEYMAANPPPPGKLHIPLWGRMLLYGGGVLLVITYLIRWDIRKHYGKRQ